MKTLKNILLDGGFFLSGKVLEKLETFCAFLGEENQKVNLTAITEKEEVYRKHILDSLFGLPFIKEGARVAEVGSGGGFPSFPLLIAAEESFSLVQFESVGKKCAFLERAAEKLALSRVQTICARAEDAGKKSEYREQFDVCLARAVAQLNSLAEYCLPLVKKGGIFLAYKGSKEATEKECAEAKNALKVLGGKIKSVVPCKISEEETHHVVVIEKVEKTPSDYPRGNGKERKNPL